MPMRHTVTVILRLHAKLNQANALASCFYKFSGFRPVWFYAVFTLVFALVPSVSAHESHKGFKYESYCCNGNAETGDCQMIPMKSVRIVQGGYEVSVVPGDHRLVTRRHVFNWSQNQTRRSEDGEYHLCLYPDENTPRCFYAPDMGF
jgi:hypothetical protein